MRTHTEFLDALERHIAVHGISGRNADLARVADMLVRTGALPTIAGILSDPTEPEPARIRALARASTALRASRVTPLLDRVA